MKSISRDKVKQYGKYIAPLAVGAGLGLGGAVYADSGPTQDEYQNLNEKLQNAQDENTDLESEVATLQTAVQGEEAKVANLEGQVTQFKETVKELRADNEDLEDAVAQAQERVGLVDYFPVFTENTDVEYDNFDVVEVDEDYNGGEGDYTEIDVETVDEDENHEYDLTVREFEEGEDANDYADDQRDYQDEVSFSVSGDEHTVGITAKEGSAVNNFHIHYEDDDVLEDVNDDDDIESVIVDGEDVTDDVDSISKKFSGDELVVSLETNKNYVNEGEEISVTFSNAGKDEAPEYTHFNGETYDYEQDSDQFVYQDGNFVVTGEGFEGSGDEDDYDAQYEEFSTQYE